MNKQHHPRQHQQNSDMSSELDAWRQSINAIDHTLCEALTARFSVLAHIAQSKQNIQRTLASKDIASIHNMDVSMDVSSHNAESVHNASPGANDTSSTMLSPSSKAIKDHHHGETDSQDSLRACALFDASREQSVMERVLANTPKEHQPIVRHLFRQLMGYSLSQQTLHGRIDVALWTSHDVSASIEGCIQRYFGPTTRIAHVAPDDFAHGVVTHDAATHNVVTHDDVRPVGERAPAITEDQETFTADFLAILGVGINRTQRPWWQVLSRSWRVVAIVDTTTLGSIAYDSSMHQGHGDIVCEREKSLQNAMPLVVLTPSRYYHHLSSKKYASHHLVAHAHHHPDTLKMLHDAQGRCVIEYDDQNGNTHQGLWLLPPQAVLSVKMRELVTVWGYVS